MYSKNTMYSRYISSTLINELIAELSKILTTRLLGRFAPIFYLNCEHVLFVYILKQRRNNFADLKKTHLFLSFINLPCGLFRTETDDFIVCCDEQYPHV